jgi:hypothetical protein
VPSQNHDNSAACLRNGGVINRSLAGLNELLKFSCKWWRNDSGSSGEIFPGGETGPVFQRRRLTAMIMRYCMHATILAVSPPDLPLPPCDSVISHHQGCGYIQSSSHWQSAVIQGWVLRLIFGSCPFFCCFWPPIMQYHYSSSGKACPHRLFFFFDMTAVNVRGLSGAPNDVRNDVLWEIHLCFLNSFGCREDGSSGPQVACMKRI